MSVLIDECYVPPCLHADRVLTSRTPLHQDTCLFSTRPEVTFNNMFSVQSSLCTRPTSSPVFPTPPLHGLACRSEADGVSAGLVVCMRVVYVDTLRSTLNQLRHPDTCAALALVCGCVVAAVVSIRSN